MNGRVRAEREMIDTLLSLLDPRKFTHMSDKMTACVRAIFAGDVIVTTDGFVLIHSGNVFIGTIDDLERNWKELLDAAKLTDEQREFADRMWDEGVARWDQPHD